MPISSKFINANYSKLFCIWVLTKYHYLDFFQIFNIRNKKVTQGGTDSCALWRPVFREWDAVWKNTKEHFRLHFKRPTKCYLTRWGLARKKKFTPKFFAWKGTLNVFYRFFLSVFVYTLLNYCFLQNFTTIAFKLKELYCCDIRTDGRTDWNYKGSVFSYGTLKMKTATQSVEPFLSYDFFSVISHL